MSEQNNKHNCMEKEPRIIAFNAWLKQLGRSGITGWRWEQYGWIKPFNIAGKKFITVEDALSFEERAINGEFSRPPHGAAAKSVQLKKSKAK